ncbi:Zn-dependent hydrolase [Peribacillus asahii]|uniref:Zn-dependent hydrolase n=1 Tax=Peribacillus asahii TaxID=228899 RepID=UPI0037F7952A
MLTLTIDNKRLLQSIKASSIIGPTQNGGLNRLALSDEDKVMRDLFKQWMEEEGLQVRYDDFGNMYGRREGINNDDAAVLVGSHLDTQPNGGKFDGVLGVLAALEVIRVLNENNIKTKRPIEIVNFTNEEGARFEPPMLGSGGIANIFSRDFVYSIQDKDGKSFGEELEKTGYLGTEKNRANHIHRYVELHIEQGPVLENYRTNIGAVTGIQGMTWLEVKISGHSAHAGTTPLSMRKDALLMSSKMITLIHEIASQIDSNSLVTIGRISAFPGAVNCVSGEVVFSVDVRHPDDSIRENVVEVIRETLSTSAASENFGITISELWEIKTSHFSEDIVCLIEDAAKERNYSCERIISGAGHDAKYMNHIVPSGMIFVPSIDGKSHCEDELTLDDDLIRGTNILLDVTLSLSQS